MDKVLDFIKDSVPWLFSGAGVSLIGFFLYKKRRIKASVNIKQAQKNGDKSVNIQIGQQNKYYTENRVDADGSEDNG